MHIQDPAAAAASQVRPACSLYSGQLARNNSSDGGGSLQLRCCWLPETRRSLQEEDATLAVKVPLPINRLCRVRQWLSEKVAALDAEQAALEGKQMVRPARMHAAHVVAANPGTHHVGHMHTLAVQSNSNGEQPRTYPSTCPGFVAGTLEGRVQAAVAGDGGQPA